MNNCIVVVQFPLDKRTKEQAIAGGILTAPYWTTWIPIQKSVTPKRIGCSN